MHRLLLTVLILALGACRDDITYLSDQELSALLTHDRRIAFERIGYTGTALLALDRTFQVTVPRLGKDTGEWWLHENQICGRWARFRQGRTQCAVVGKTDEGVYRGFSPSQKVYLGDFRFLE